MNQLTKITYLLVLLSIVSCKYEIEPVPADFHHKLVVIAELEADISPEFIISTTYNIDEDPILLPQTMRVEVYDVENLGEPNSFRLANGKDGIVWNPPGQFIPRKGKEYQIIVDVNDPDMEMDAIIATTMVPFPGDIESREPVTYIQEATQTRFDISMTLETPPDTSNYYHLIPYLTTAGDTLALNVSDIEEGINASSVLSHRDGMLIDVSKLNEENRLIIEAKSLLPLNVDQMVEPRMVYELKTVTEEYYNYHLNISATNYTNLGPFTLPVITYSQFIEDGMDEPYGYGVFSAVSKVYRSVEVVK